MISYISLKLIHDINPTTKRWPCDSHGGNTYAALGGAVGCTQVGEDQGRGDAHETRRGPWSRWVMKTPGKSIWTKLCPLAGSGILNHMDPRKKDQPLCLVLDFQGFKTRVIFLLRGLFGMFGRNVFWTSEWLVYSLILFLHWIRSWKSGYPRVFTVHSRSICLKATVLFFCFCCQSQKLCGVESSPNF